MNIPTELKYTKEHEWVRLEDDDVVTVGITEFAQEALGDIVYVEVPAIGDEIEAGAEFGVVESVKAVSDIYAPLAGEVVDVNLVLEDTPELINESPYDEGWLLKIKLANIADFEALLDAEGYREILAAES